MYREKLLLVDDVERFGQFAYKLLDRNTCTPEVLAAFEMMSVSRVFLPLSKSTDLKGVRPALSANNGNKGAYEAEIVSEPNGTGDHDSVVLKGPNNIVFHLVKDLIYGTSVSDNVGDTSFEGSIVGPPQSGSESPMAGRRSRSDTFISMEQAEDLELEVIHACKHVVSDILEKFGGKPKPPKIRQLVIPTLDCGILTDGRFKPLVPGAPKPTPFETDIFIGTCFFTHQHEGIDPRLAPFYPSHRKVTYEIQVQGKFKRLPEGEIYCGAETMSKLELGFMTRQFAKACMSFAGMTVENLHYSFGDLLTNPDFEYPHLVGPLFPTLDKIIETNDGDPLPELGVPFKEDPEYRKKRVKWSSIKDANVSLQKTYSFSVNTQNIDCVKWAFVNIPAVGWKDLRDFFADSPVRLVAYEIPRDIVRTLKTHPQRVAKYVFNVCLTRVIPGEESDRARMLSDLEWEGQTTDEEAEGGFASDTFDLEEADADMDTNEGELLTKNGRFGSADATAKSFESDSSDDDVRSVTAAEAKDQGRLQYDDGVESELERELDVSRTEDDDAISGAGRANSAEDGNPGESGEVSSIPKFTYREGGGAAAKLTKNQYLSFTDGSGTGGVHKGYVNSLLNGLVGGVSVPSIIDVPETAGEFLVPNHESETARSLRFCPAIVEVFDHKKKAAQVMYLLPFAPLTDAGASSDPPQLVPRLRSFDDIAKKLHMEPIPKLHKNKVMVSIEKKRRQIVESYSAASAVAPSSAKVAESLKQLLQTETETDQQFLTFSQGNKSFLSKLTMSRPAAGPEKLWDGSVALALGNRHWIEYYLMVTKDGVGISHHQGTKEMWIPASAMIKAQAMQPEDVPFRGYACIFIETLRKMYYLMVKDEQSQAGLLSALLKLGVTQKRTIDKSMTVGVDEIFPELIFKSRMEIWKLQNRRLYNCRRLLFTAFGVPPPCELAERLLEKALQLSDIWKNRTRSLEMNDTKFELILLWVDFLDELSNLQVVNVAALGEAERAAFFLNLHHIMVIHASLVLFPPQTSSNWQAFFHNVSYLLAFDVVSIAEVEHNILKATMTKPPRSAIGLGRAKHAPKSDFPGLALKHRDFRLNFCINNGSIAMPAVVCIFRAATLDDQLDHMTALAVSMMITVDVAKRMVHLPMTCSWFAPDFVSTGTVVSSIDCLRTIAMYCRPEDREALDSLLLSGTTPTIKYRPYTFQSRLIGREVAPEV